MNENQQEKPERNAVELSAVEPSAATAEPAAEPAAESAAESAVQRRSERRVACMTGCLHGFSVLVLTGLVCAGVLVMELQHREEQYYEIPTVLKYLTGNQYTVVAHGFGPVDDNLFRTSYRYLLANTGANVLTNLAILNALNCELLPPDESNVRISDFRTPEGIRRHIEPLLGTPLPLGDDCVIVSCPVERTSAADEDSFYSNSVICYSAQTGTILIIDERKW